MTTKNNTKKSSNPQVSEGSSENSRIAAIKKTQVVATQYSGPIPLPSDFQKYEEALPGSADRILQMAENQSAHRQNLEKTVIFSGVQDSKRGQYFAFIIALVIIVGGFYLIAIDKDGIGISAVVGSVGTLVGVFIYGRKSEREERNEKQDDNL